VSQILTKFFNFRPFQTFFFPFFIISFTFCRRFSTRGSQIRVIHTMADSAADARPESGDQPASEKQVREAGQEIAAVFSDESDSENRNGDAEDKEDDDEERTQNKRVQPRKDTLDRDEDSQAEETSDEDDSDKKKRKSGKRASSVFLDPAVREAYSTQATTLLKRMEDAAIADREVLEQALRTKKPGKASAKLRLLPEVQAVCKRPALRGPLVAQGLLGRLREWLDPLDEQRTMLPAVDIRTAVLEILLQLPLEGEVSGMQDAGDFVGVTYDLLTAAGIGKTVMMLSRHPSETEANKIRCRQLIRRFEKLLDGLRGPSSSSSSSAAAAGGAANAASASGAGEDSQLKQQRARLAAQQRRERDIEEDAEISKFGSMREYLKWKSMREQQEMDDNPLSKRRRAQTQSAAMFDRDVAEAICPQLNKDLGDEPSRKRARPEEAPSAGAGEFYRRMGRGAAGKKAKKSAISGPSLHGTND
jgi:hypothetical protein